MPPDILPSAGLAETAHLSMVDLFSRVGHKPSQEQWEAILDLLDHMELAVTGGLAHAAYVSAIPAGTGKTVSIVAMTKAILDSPNYADAGVLIACSRIAEVKDMAEELAAHRGKLCVIVGVAQPEVLALGAHSDANGAQVVVTTHEALKRSLKTSRSFDSCTRYHHQGRRRELVLWDEAIAFSRPVILDADTVSGLAKELRRQSPEAATVLKEWAVALDRAEGECAVPDFVGMGVDFHRLEEDSAERDDLASQVRALAVLSGGMGWVVRENVGASSLISHVPEIPESLLPVIVTGASAAEGVHHASYVQMAQTRPIVRLKEATKTYANMTIRVVPTAASRSTYRDKTATKGKDLIEMAVCYIRSVAPERVLIVSYKTWMAMKGVEERTIRAAIDARLTPEERDRVSHLTWGSHTSTNAFKDHRRVMLMGLNFLPPTASYAASGAALNKPMRTAAAEDHPTTEQVEDMRVGMLRDSTLQAILRGHARKAVDGDCGAMEVVIPQVRQTGLSDADYRGMFPGVVLSVDSVLLPAKPLKGKLRTLSEIVARRLGDGEREMTNPGLSAELGMAPRDFRALVKRPEWLAWTAAVGLVPCPLKGRVMGLRSLAPPVLH